MPHFFFEIVMSAERIEDLEGFELADLVAAEAEADDIADQLREEIGGPFAEIEIRTAPALSSGASHSAR